MADSPDPQSPAPTPRTEDRPLRVLLVEDNPINQQVLLLLLQRAGYQVDLATNGMQALEVFEQGPFDIVLMDVQMPEMDGIRAARLIRAREKAIGGHVPIIAVTANAMPGERQRCLTAGMDDYLSKPVRSSELFRAITRLLANHGKIESESASVDVRDEPQPEWAPSSGMSVPREILVKLVQTFVETVPARLEGLKQAVAAGDVLQVERTAHSLKGSLAVFTARSAVQAAAALELAGREQRQELISELLADLEKQVAPLLASMKEFLEQSSGVSALTQPITE